MQVSVWWVGLVNPGQLRPWTPAPRLTVHQQHLRGSWGSLPGAHCKHCSHCLHVNLNSFDSRNCDVILILHIRNYSKVKLRGQEVAELRLEPRHLAPCPSRTPHPSALRLLLLFSKTQIPHPEIRGESQRLSTAPRITSNKQQLLS